jgi:hypothetical protein
MRHERYSVDDLQSDIGHVHQLVEEIAEQFVGLDFGPVNSRNHGMDRLNALIWIARDLMVDMNHNVQEHYREIGGKE